MSSLPLLFLLLFIHPILISSREFNPYKTLGLRRSASQKDIKQAYKRMAMEWHPDKNKDPEAEQHFMEINQAYKILSNAQKRKAYDTYGFTEEQFEQMRREQQFQDQGQYQQQFQYVRWPPPPRRKQTDITHFLLPFGSVLGTLFFIFLVGYLLNQMNTSEQAKRRRQNNNNSRTGEGATNNNGSGQKDQQEKEWHPEDPKAPLTEEEKQQRMQSRMWRVMSPMIRELRAETQFGLIRLLKPGCRSIVVLVDKDSKNVLLQQFARHVYCLKNNKTFSFGFLMVPKNLGWFRSLLELTLPGDEQQQETDSASVSTATTDTAETEGAKNGEEEKMVSKEKESGDGRKNSAKGEARSARNKLKEINPKHTLGTVLVLCGWKLYFSIYHPMHRPMSIRSRIALAELGDQDDQRQDYEDDHCGDQCGGGGGGEDRVDQLKRKAMTKERETGRAQGPVNVDNVLNGLPMFLDRLLEGTIRRYYVPEWPENLI